MGSLVSMTYIVILLALFTLTLGQGPSVPEDVPSPALGFRCPMLDVDFQFNDVEEVDGIEDWQTCGHICNLTAESICKFWTLTYDKRCIFKSSDEGLQSLRGAISGARGCEE